MKLQLQDVTLICVDCVDVQRAINVLKRCTDLVDFGAVKLLTSKETLYPNAVKIGPIGNLTEYSDFMIKYIWEYVDTPYMQIVQHDGWILNPEVWEDDWKRYDYIGPLFLQEKNVDNDSVGVGGFSFRSRKMMKFIAENCFYGYQWYGYIHEDGVICKTLKPMLAKAGFAFAPPDRAAKYAAGGNAYCACTKPFGFHGYWALPALENTLAQIYAKYPSSEVGCADKGSVHSYIQYYESLLFPYRNCKSVLEIGISHGNSLRMWEDFFKDAKVYGMNNTSEGRDGEGLKAMIAEGTHNIVIGDACSHEQVESKYSGMKFDIIIEDASHVLEHSLEIYKNFKDKVAPGGLYIIEDVNNIDQVRQTFMDIDPSKTVDIIDLRPFKGRYDDVLVVIKDKQ